MTKPYVREIIYREPAKLALRLDGQRALTVLESGQRAEQRGSYSFIACNPSTTIESRGGKTYCNGVHLKEPALQILDEVLKARSFTHVEDLPPFQGGVAGYIGYDYGRVLDAGVDVSDFPNPAPDLSLHVYDAVLAFDHLQERAWIISTTGEQAADNLELLLKQPARALGRAELSGWTSNFTRETYEAAVQKTVDYILAGDIFQANISQCFSASIDAGFDALAYYRNLRAKNPAPFSAYLNYGDVKITSSSPERLLSIVDGHIEARPIKGTRKRVADPELDAALVADLLASRKDRAENVMIVDLLRNDLSKVCKLRSVKVPVLCGLESYTSVHHLTSVVVGEMRPEQSIGDVIAAAFPGGSITGAPKIRAMEIIAEIEQQARGIYCGSIGYFGFNGRVDLNIAIRTVMFAGGVAKFQGGGGITARSEPGPEYDETLVKVARIMESFRP